MAKLRAKDIYFAFTMAGILFLGFFAMYSTERAERLQHQLESLAAYHEVCPTHPTPLLAPNHHPAASKWTGSDAPLRFSASVKQSVEAYLPHAAQLLKHPRAAAAHLRPKLAAMAAQLAHMLDREQFPAQQQHLQQPQQQQQQPQQQETASSDRAMQSLPKLAALYVHTAVHAGVGMADLQQVLEAAADDLPIDKYFIIYPQQEVERIPPVLMHTAQSPFFANGTMAVVAQAYTAVQQCPAAPFLPFIAADFQCAVPPAPAQTCAQPTLQELLQQCRSQPAASEGAECGTLAAQQRWAALDTEDFVTAVFALKRKASWVAAWVAPALQTAQVGCWLGC
jgi:hypothetical protein